MELKEAKAGFYSWNVSQKEITRVMLLHWAGLVGGWRDERERETQGLSITTFHHHYLGEGTDSPSLGSNLLLASMPPLFLRAGEDLLKPWLSVAWVTFLRPHRFQHRMVEGSTPSTCMPGVCVCVCVCVCAKSLQVPGLSVHEIFQARILDWVAMPFCSGSFWPRDWTCISYISCISGWIIYH